MIVPSVQRSTRQTYGVENRSQDREIFVHTCIAAAVMESVMLTAEAVVSNVCNQDLDAKNISVLPVSS